MLVRMDHFQQKRAASDIEHESTFSAFMPLRHPRERAPHLGSRTMLLYARVRVESVWCVFGAASASSRAREQLHCVIGCVCCSAYNLSRSFNDFLQQAARDKSDGYPKALDDLSKAGIRLVIADSNDPDSVGLAWVIIERYEIKIRDLKLRPEVGNYDQR